MSKAFDPTRSAALGYTREDWDEVSDNPEWTDEDFACAKPMSEALPDLYEDIRRELRRRRTLTSASSRRSSR